MKTLRNSRTVRFNAIMAAIQAFNGSLYLLEPILTAEQFAVVSICIGLIHAIGSVYYRSITSEPIG